MAPSSTLTQGQEERNATSSGLTLRDFRLARIDDTGHVILSDGDVDRIVRRLAEFVVILDTTRDTKLQEQIDELEDVRDDVVRSHKRTLSDLETFGRHLSGCAARKRGSNQFVCSCGLEDALDPKEVSDE